MNIVTYFKTPKAVSALCAAAVVLGAFHAFVSRYTMNADGVSYVDIGESYFRLPAHLAVSGYFSPLYCWLLGVVLVAVRPNAQWESPVVHLVNYLLFLCALWCFKGFVDELLRLKRAPGGAAALHDGDYSCHECAWAIFFYTLFVWAALRMITMASVAPDMLYTAVMFFLYSRLLRMRRDQGGYLYAAGLGLILGIAYLARAAALPIVFLVLMSLFILYGNLRRSVPRVVMTVAVFLLIAGPYVALLSIARGRANLGGTGTMIYAWHVDHKPWQNWQGPGAAHPTRLIYKLPAVYEFGTPVTGTYPPWYDPSYWDEGMSPEYRLIPLVSNFVTNSKHLFDYFLELGGILVGLVSLHLAARTGIHGFLKELRPVWYIVLPSAIALIIYASLHVEPRYIMPFWLTLWMAMFLALPFSFRDDAPPFSVAILAAMVVFLGADILASTLALPREISYATNNNQIAASLIELPVHQAEKVATIGVSNNVYWARLARLRVVAEIPIGDGPDFWAAPQAVKDDIYGRLAEKSVDVIVARGVPSQFTANPWRPLGDDFFACRLSELRGGQ